MELLIIFGLILLNGLFSMMEMALVSVRKTKLEAEANHGNKSATNVLKLLKKPDRFLSTIQIGITLIGILTGIFSGDKIKHNLMNLLSQHEKIESFSEPLATLIIVIIVTYLTLILGELVPKRLGLSRPEVISKKMTPFMNLLNIITFPFIWILSASTQLIIRILKIKINENSVTEDEIRTLINESAEQGQIEIVEQEIIERVFHLGDRNITSLMTHRSEVFWIEINMSKNEIHDYIRKNLHSVYPVCEGDIDNIKGMLRTKDLYASSDDQALDQLCKPALFVPENISAYQVLEKFRIKGMDACLIVDEYGTLQGMITLNNIFGAIVGDILENNDEDYKIIKRDDKSYWIDAQIHFYDFLSYFDCEDKYASMGNFDTLAGFILHILEHIPKEGEHFTWNEFYFEIADMDNNRIDKVLVMFNP